MQPSRHHRHAPSTAALAVPGRTLFVAEEDPHPLAPQLVDAIRETVREAVPAPIHDAVRGAMAETGHRRIDEAIQETILETVNRCWHQVEGRVEFLTAQHEREMKAMADEEARRIQRRSEALLWAVLKPVVAGLVVVAVLAAAGWGLYQWTALRLRTAVAALTEVEERTAEARLRLDDLAEQTWGVALIRSDGQCLVLLPEDVDVETHLRFDGRRAVELPCPTGASND